jgi:hypothetical protein
MATDELRVPKIHQEWDQTERCLSGRDPRRMTTAKLAACGIVDRPLLAAIRAKCLDCMGGQRCRGAALRGRRLRPLGLPQERQLTAPAGPDRGAAGGDG